jgi:hypothetical protein
LPDSCAFETTFAAETDPTNDVLFALPLNVVDVIVPLTLLLPIEMLVFCIETPLVDPIEPTVMFAVALT